MKTQIDQIPDLLFHTAQGFYDIALNCAYNVSKDNEITGFQRIAPGAVNLCFAAELLLKGLLLLTSKKDIKGHHLKLLFNELPESLRVQIELRYKYHIEQDKDKKDYGAFKIVLTKKNKEKKEQDDSDDVSLDKLLTTHNKGFENWRYLYEIGRDGYTYEIDFKSMNCFIKSIVDTINTLPQKQRLYLSKTK